ncbi:class I SAM-dependent methyltransferase [Streptomyces kanamyceticus]|uniref:Class I SAM-dependent methyltransferase n=1 Tax=Streptomyces kanamyceticus TaxID=1967 RepID=A0A5J6GCT3_STRKN|nr:class I SAM-dependent methyltransferase [Streptomyces kanamyceticus]QEU93369.1 class I SAM-dependent methyltransferase [Streptomyces kanamyceticus]
MKALTVTDTELRIFARHVPVRCHQVALDAGCGSGNFSRQLHRFGYDVIALDFAHSALEAARRTPLPGVTYLHHDLDQGDPPGLQYRGIDLVVCRLVLPLLRDPVRWVRRVRDRWLRPGGRMYLVIPVGEHADQFGRMTEQQISALCDGWAKSVRYDLRSTSACLVLRAPRPRWRAGRAKLRHPERLTAGSPMTTRRTSSPPVPRGARPAMPVGP